MTAVACGTRGVLVMPSPRSFSRLGSDNALLGRYLPSPLTDEDAREERDCRSRGHRFFPQPLFQGFDVNLSLGGKAVLDDLGLEAARQRRVATVGCGVRSDVEGNFSE